MYRPPPMTHRVAVRDPAAAAEPARDEFGRRRTAADAGSEVWAGRRDRRTVDEVGDGVETRGTQTVFTVRYRELPADFVVVDGGIEYLSIGAPIRRGDSVGGMRAVFLELWTERRQLSAA